MKTIAQVKKDIAELKNENRLFRYVLTDIVNDSKEYSGNFVEQVKSRCDDVGHGLSSGVVGHLIYYSDTTAFFKKYRKEIESLLMEFCDETGSTPWELLRDFDKQDIFCRDTNNQNLLAWFAYEEINNRLMNILED